MYQDNTTTFGKTDASIIHTYALESIYYNGIPNVSSCFVCRNLLCVADVNSLDALHKPYDNHAYTSIPRRELQFGTGQ
jgi:hypothetical protein